MRKLAVLVVAGAALWLAPGALAAGWCGTGEDATDRPDVTTGQQIHPVVVVFALLVGEESGGLAGAVIAVPAASIIQAIFTWSRRRSSP